MHPSIGENKDAVRFSHLQSSAGLSVLLGTRRVLTGEVIVVVSLRKSRKCLLLFGFPFLIFAYTHNSIALRGSKHTQRPVKQLRVTTSAEKTNVKCNKTLCEIE